MWPMAHFFYPAATFIDQLIPGIFQVNYCQGKEPGILIFNMFKDKGYFRVA